MAISENGSYKPSISTLIFMDLETTGLPCDVGKRNVHITELSFVAIDRNDFETDTSLRVLNKLSLCVRPRAAVSPGAMCITGLYNDMLQNQKEFDNTTAKVLELFFHRLRSPVCLLAHNGNTFDFPVLQAELKRLNCSLHPDILCADTLRAFREIYSKISCKPEQTCNHSEETRTFPLSEQTSLNLNMHSDESRTAKSEETHKTATSEETHLDISKTRQTYNHLTELKTDVPKLNISSKKGESTLSDEEIEHLLSEDMECFAGVAEEPRLENNKISESNFTYNSPTSQVQDNTNLQNEVIPAFENEHTPQKFLVNFDMKPEVGPINTVTKRRKRKIIDPTYHPKNEYKATKQKSVLARRNLFPCSETSPTLQPINLNTPNTEKKIKHFSLDKLYCHFFGTDPPKSHYAEADCITLSKVCQQINKDFLQWIDENSVIFSEIKAMW